jgi:2-phosphosulfolactate phosphatase
VALAAQQLGQQISVIAGGEKWPDGTLRVSIEDLLGAGAIIAYLEGTWSPEAEIAAAAFRSSRDNLQTIIRRCSSGKELAGRGRAQDVELASELDVSRCVPMLVEGAYQREMRPS